MTTKRFLIDDAVIEVEVADTFFTRFRGLMGRKNLERGCGLFIVPCSSVHMMFMRFAIDVVYVDKNFKIKKIVENLSTWTGLSMCIGAWGVLELFAGEARRLNLKVGQTFAIEED